MSIIIRMTDKQATKVELSVIRLPCTQIVLRTVKGSWSCVILNKGLKLYKGCIWLSCLPGSCRNSRNTCFESRTVTPVVVYSLWFNRGNLMRKDHSQT